MNTGFKEPINHGDVLFPFCIYKNERNGIDDRILYFHWHNEIEIIYLSQGNVVFEVDGHPLEVKSGQSIIINSKKLHAAYTIDHNPCTFYAIVFDMKLLFSYSNDIIQNKFIDPIVYDKKEFPQIICGEDLWEKNVQTQIIKMLEVYEKKDLGYEIVLKACLYNVFSEIIIHGKLVNTEDKSANFKQYQIERIKKILTYIHEHYNVKLTIDELAKEANISRHHFSRLFKALTGMTTVEYINHYRIEQAVELMGKTNSNISDIALEVGFDNISYFIKTFKKFIGCLPSKYYVIKNR